MKIRWELSDIVDLEYFLGQDRALVEEAGEDALKERDRALYINDIAGKGAHTVNQDRGVLTRKWLDAMRHREEACSDTVLPGRLWKEVYNLFAWGLTASGIITGATLAFSLLSYSGKTPVNVFLFLAVLIFPQIVLLISALILYAGRKLLKRDNCQSPLISLLLKLFAAAARRVSQAVHNTISEQDVLNLQTISGTVRASRRIYGNIFFWPFFILLQLFGAGFNAGALGATLLKVAGSDLAFGWQSTLRIGAETIASMVRVLAAPWSWFMPGACPGIEQIQGSRMILKEGIYHLSTTDLTSWWPFLCMCILFYGLIPRIALLAWARVMLARSLSNLRFNAACFRDIERRMTMPSVISSGETMPDEQGCSTSLAEAKTGSETRSLSESLTDSLTDSLSDHDGHATGKSQAEQAMLLIPDELLETLSIETITEACRRLRIDPSVVLAVQEPCEPRTEPCGKEIRARLDAATAPATIVLVQEAWQPPIQEMLQFVHAIRDMAGPDALILIALTGQPAPDGSIMPVTKQDFRIWQQKIRNLGDPGLQVKVLLS